MSTTIPSSTSSNQSSSTKKKGASDIKGAIEENRKFPSELVEKGWRLANEGRRFYAHNDKTEAMTVLHDTIEAVAEEATEIDARSQSYGQHEFIPKQDSKTICALCFQGRNGKPHRQWKEAQKKNDLASQETASGTDESGSQKRVIALAFLADLEDEQKGRWATLCEYERLYEAATKIRDKRRLTKERMRIVADYDRAWDEAIKALDNNEDVVQEVRDRVEASGSTIATDADSAGGSALVESGEPPAWHEYFEQTPGEGCFLGCGKPEDDPIHHEPATAERAENGDAAETLAPLAETDDAGSQSPFIFTKEIEVELADSDYKAKSRQLAFLRVQIEELQAEKKTADEGYKQKIGGLEEQCTELFRSIRRGRDTLKLEVFERRDYGRKVVETVRADTQAVVESRPMLPRELQQPLPSI